MREKLILGAPFTRDVGEYSQLVSIVTMPDGRKDEIWYQVDIMWGGYYVTEVCDAFLVDVIYYALSYGLDIICEAPVSEKLLYQLKYHYLPVIIKSKPFFSEISIEASAVVPKYKTEGYAATGISCGVDSYYTMMKHMNTGIPAYDIKVALFQDWFSIGMVEDEKQAWRKHFKSLTDSVAEELGIRTIYVSCNIDEILKTPDFIDPYYGRVCDKGLYTYKYCSTAFALGKLINKYYFSSGYDLEHFNLKPKGEVFDEDHYSLFNVAFLSSEMVEVFHFGGEATRIDKLDYLSQYSLVKKTLSVCSNFTNCGICPKCIRTMGELYSIGKLDEFEQCFPIDKFKDHLVRNFAYIIINSGNDFFAEIIDRCKDNKIKIPKSAYLIAPFMYVDKNLRKKLKHNKVAKLLYYRGKYPK